MGTIISRKDHRASVFGRVEYDGSTYLFRRDENDRLHEIAKLSGQSDLKALQEEYTVLREGKWGEG